MEKKAFEQVVERASVWVAAEEARILQTGVRLTDLQIDDARNAGVKHPERIRIKQVPEVCPPSDPVLLEFMKSLGPGKSLTRARAYRYGIAVRVEDWADRQLLVHEFVHVKQYEELGSLKGFLSPYLTELMPPIGYPNGPLEQEAIHGAARICGIPRLIPFEGGNPPPGAG